MCESRAKRKENSRCYRGSSGDLCPQRAVQHFPAVLGDACCDGSAQCFNTSKSTVRFYFHILHSKWVDRELVASSIFSTLYFCHREGSNSLPSALLMLHVLILGIWQSIWFMRHNISTYRLWTSQCSDLLKSGQNTQCNSNWLSAVCRGCRCLHTKFITAPHFIHHSIHAFSIAYPDPEAFPSQLSPLPCPHTLIGNNDILITLN